MAIALIIFGLLFALSGIVGCILPVIPGPVLSFLSLIILSCAKNWEPFSATFLILMGSLMVLVTILDYVVPAGGAKKYGASRLGVGGSVIGMLTGFFFLPPLGLFIGAFLGALAGELLARKEGKDALRAGWGVFVGIVVGIGLKLAFTGVVLFFYIKELL
ncbi:MAG: DUF456 domain-containing protein [Syntrophobacterales bacterium]|nr:DUF456 domain-containing protein [Syntrophobacterales bacterium]